ncbi:MAG TPA: hypothetical protein VF772_18105, partial [Terriglobales bacterium]
VWGRQCDDAISSKDLRIQRGMAARRARTTQTADAATNFGVKFHVRVTSASPPRSVDVQMRG